MELNINGKSKKTSKKKKKEIIPIEEINKLQQLNLKNISSLEEASKDYNKKQIQRDEDWFNIEVSLDEKMKILNSETKSIKNELRQMKQTFSVLAKNFRNFVKKDEINIMQNRISSMKFEELATEQDLINELKN